MTSQSLARKVALLEQRAARLRQPDDEVSAEAARRLFDALHAVIRGDQQPATATRGPLSAAMDFEQQLAALAGRLDGAEETDDDRRALDAIPADALAIFGWSAADFVRTVAVVLQKF